jgi:potassium efflux system protein
MRFPRRENFRILILALLATAWLGLGDRSLAQSTSAPAGEPASSSAQAESPTTHHAFAQLTSEPASGPTSSPSETPSAHRRLVGKMLQAARDLQQVQDELAKVRGRFVDIQKRLAYAGKSSAVFSLMRKARSETPDPLPHEEKIRLRAEEISDVQLRLLDLQEQRDALGDTDPAKTEMLDDSIHDYGDYLTTLAELDTQEQMLVDETRRFQTLVEGSILWTPSAKPISLDDAGPAGQALRYLVAPTNWAGAAATAWRNFLQAPLPMLAGLVAAGLILVYRPKILARLRRVAQGIRDGVADTFGRSLEALLWAVVLTAPLPGLVLLASTLFISPQKFDAGLSRGLLNIGMTLAALQFLRQVCRPMGLAEAHFDWPAQSLRTGRRALRFLMLAICSTMFLMPLLASSGNDASRTSLGRLVLTVQFVAMAVFMHVLLRPRGPIVDHAIKTGLFHRFRHVWHALGLAAPVLAIVLAWAGYVLTAGVLSQRLVYTFLFISLAVIVLTGAKRALSVGLRRARADLRTAGTIASPIPAGQAGSPAPWAETQNTRNQIDHLLRFTTMLVMVLIVWWVWTPIIPALGMLKHVELWGGTVSLADAGLAVIVLVLTFVLCGNFPALVEAVVLQRLPIDTGARYAIRTVLRYVIGVVGTVVALGLVGVEWSNVQWLVAAMTVGLGFGLQEIFANFVSGLIILFERPIRLGDTVTVGDVTGTITKMRIRATVVTDWNCRELIVPNKDFIVGRVVNWTLSDRLLRLALPVPLPPDFDPAKAEAILMDAARKHPQVLKVPAPTAVLTDLTPAAMKFELRVFIRGAETPSSGSMDNPSAQGSLLQAQTDQVRHELNMAIEKAFLEAKPPASAVVQPK